MVVRESMRYDSAMRLRTTWTAFARWASSDAGALALFLLLSALLYGSTIGAEFVYDDAFFTVRPDMREWTYLWNVWSETTLKHMTSSIYRPLTFFTFSLNFLLFGDSPASFHAVSILLNGVACWLVFLVTKRLFGRHALAWLTALLFAFLPIHTESVAYVKARDELLVAVFGLSAWLAFLAAVSHDTRRRLAWSIAAGVCSLLAFFSKESALVFPGVLGGSLLLTHGLPGVRRAWIPLAVQLGAVAAFLAIRSAALWQSGILPEQETLYFGQNPLGYADPSFIPWTAFTLFFIALSKTFLPWNLSATYGFNHVPLIDHPFGSWMAPAGAALLLCLLALIAWRRTRGEAAGIGALAFLTLFFPFSKIPFTHSIDLFAERWLYAPSVGAALIGGYALWMLWRRSRSIALGVCVLISAAYLSVLLPSVAAWRNETTLGESMVRSAPNAVTSYVFLAKNRLMSGRLNEAVQLIGEGYGITLRHAPMHHIAAMAALDMDRIDLAEQAVSDAENLNDELLNDLLRAQILIEQGRFQESLDTVQNSPWFDGSDFRVRQLLALNLWRLGRTEEARTYFDWDALLPSVRMTDDEKIAVFESF